MDNKKKSTKVRITKQEQNISKSSIIDGVFEFLYEATPETIKELRNISNSIFNIIEEHSKRHHKDNK